MSALNIFQNFKSDASVIRHNILVISVVLAFYRLLRSQHVVAQFFLLLLLLRSLASIFSLLFDSAGVFV